MRERERERGREKEREGLTSMPVIYDILILGYAFDRHLCCLFSCQNIENYHKSSAAVICTNKYKTERETKIKSFSWKSLSQISIFVFTIQWCQKVWWSLIIPSKIISHLKLLKMICLLFHDFIQLNEFYAFMFSKYHYDQEILISVIIIWHLNQYSFWKL